MRRAALWTTVAFPALLSAQSPEPPNAVMFQFARFADLFGSRLVAAFDSIPAGQYAYRPTTAQQTIGYIAQHLEGANYGLCERMGARPRRMTARDSLADTVKARWPKDTLVARLKQSLRYCDAALEQVTQLKSAALASTLLAFETDLAEHYSQVAVYMRLMGMVPPSALLPVPRAALTLSAASLPMYAGNYEVVPGFELNVAIRDGALTIQSNMGGPPARLWAESPTDFFVKEVDAQVTFTNDGAGNVTGLVLHQYGRDRPAKRVR